MEPFLLWEVYVEASISLNLEGHVNYLNEYNPPKWGFGGSGSIDGDIEAGVYAYANLLGYKASAKGGVTAGVQFVVTTEGDSPNQELKGQFTMKAVSLVGHFSLKNEQTDEDVFSPFEMTFDLWDGWQGDKMTIIKQPKQK